MFPARRMLRLIALLLALSAIPVWSSYAQESTPQPAATALAEVEIVLPPRPPVDATVAQARQPRTLLPIVLTAPAVNMQIAAAINENTLEPINPGRTFNHGIQRLYASAQVLRAAGQTWKIETTYPDGEIVPVSGAVRSNITRVASFICLTTAATCGTGEVALERGAYKFKLFLNNRLYQEVSVEIR